MSISNFPENNLFFYTQSEASFPPRSSYGRRREAGWRCRSARCTQSSRHFPVKGADGTGWPVLVCCSLNRSGSDRRGNFREPSSGRAIPFSELRCFPSDERKAAGNFIPSSCRSRWSWGNSKRQAGRRNTTSCWSFLWTMQTICARWEKITPLPR